MSAATETAASAQSVADRLRGVVVNLRADLDVSRHLFRNQPTYIIRDPVSFQTHSLDPQDYAIFVALDRDEPLGDTFNLLVERGELDADDEDSFYGFVLSLHRSGLLNLPVTDGKALYQRFDRRRRAKRKSLLMSVFFLRVPIWDPDVFLSRTIGYVRWAFTRYAFVAWLLLMLGAGLVAFTKRDELAAPLLTVLEVQNLPILWVVLVTLKIAHEFGHAFACKAFGGDVPEMGAFFIVGTPCAYVDATSAWGFPERKHRLAVSLAGMYIETLFAAVGLFVWAATEPGLLNSVAFQTALLASVVTIGFNLNPLAKFDGYYILSDALAIPNLRQRAADELRRVFDRVALGLKPEPSAFPILTRLFLIAFGIGSMLYRVTLVVGISAMVATKFFIVGIGLAALYVGMSLVGFVTKSIRYLWMAPQTAAVRPRAIAVSILGLALLPAALLFTPVPAAGGAWGVFAYQREHVLRAAAPGIVVTESIQQAQTLEANAPIATLDNTELIHDARVKAAEHRLAQLRQQHMLDQGPTAFRIEHDRVAAAREAYEHAAHQASQLQPRTTIPGAVVFSPIDDRPGAFVKRGDTLAVLAEGDLVAQLLVDEDLIAGSTPLVGDIVELRAASDPDRLIHGRVMRVADAGSREIDNATLTTGSNAIAATPGAAQPSAAHDPGDTGLATEPATAGRAYFSVTVAIPTDDAQHLHRGGAVRARFSTARVPAGLLVYRKLVRFLNELRSG